MSHKSSCPVGWMDASQDVIDEISRWLTDFSEFNQHLTSLLSRKLRIKYMVLVELLPKQVFPLTWGVFPLAQGLYLKSLHL